MPIELVNSAGSAKDIAAGSNIIAAAVKATAFRVIQASGKNGFQAILEGFAAAVKPLCAEKTAPDPLFSSGAFAQAITVNVDLNVAISSRHELLTLDYHLEQGKR
jgi:hypothetical protein